MNIWELMTALATDIDGQPGTNVVSVAKNILELTITGKIKMIPTIPDALFAASIAMRCVLFLHARLREIFRGNDWSTLAATRPSGTLTYCSPKPGK